MNVFILAGGKSSRFREDKTLFKIKDKALIEITIDQVKKFSKNIIIVAKNIKKIRVFKSKFSRGHNSIFYSFKRDIHKRLLLKKGFFCSRI